MQTLTMPTPRTTHTVKGGGGVDIAVQEWGNPEGHPIIFIHALMQSHLGYLPILKGPLEQEARLITFDTRGHGDSGKPENMAAYQDGEQLADDLAAVIGLVEDAKPIVVAWSIGGVILDDYLAKYGDDGISGAVYLGAGHALGEGANKYVAAGFAQTAPAVISPNLATRVRGTIEVGRANTAQPLPDDRFMLDIAVSMVVPPQARAGLISRSVNHIIDTLPSTTVPMRFLHGSEDQIVELVSSKDAAAAAPNGTYVEIADIGHAPATEATESVVKAIRSIMA
ncbi:MAG: alpha/beta hydrolase [Cyanobacteria bacterium P01_F01_bin.150]